MNASKNLTSLLSRTTMASETLRPCSILSMILVCLLISTLIHVRSIENLSALSVK